MSISAPTLPFDLACKGAFVDAAGVTSDSPSALGGDVSLSFATVLAGAVPTSVAVTAQAPAVPLTPASPIHASMLPLPGAMEPGLPVEQAAAPETNATATRESSPVEMENASDPLGVSGPAVPFFTRHARSPHRPQANPAALGLRLGQEVQRRPVDGGMPTDVAAKVADLQTGEARPKVGARSGESDGMAERSETEASVPADCQPVVIAPTGVPAAIAPVVPAMVSPVFSDTRCGGEGDALETPSDVLPESDDSSQPAAVVPSEVSSSPRSEVRRPETARDLNAEPVRFSSSAASERPVPGSAEPTTHRAESTRTEPSETARPDLPGALQKGERVPVSQNASTEPQGKGIAVARTSRASARAQEVAATKTEEHTEPLSPASAATKASKAAPAERSLSPDKPAKSGLPAPVRTETETVSVGRPPVETPGMTVPRPFDPGFSAPVAPVASPASDPMVPSERVLARSTRFAAPSPRSPLDHAPATSTGSSPSTSGQAFTLTDAPEGLDRAQPAATDSAHPVANGLDGESAWRRLPLAVQERVTLVANVPVSSTPSWSQLRTVPAPVLPAPDAESLLSLEQAALDLVSEVTADGLPMTRTAESDAASPLRRPVVPESMEKIAATVGDAFRDRVKGRAHGEPEPKRNLLNADQKEFAISKFALGTEAADRRALMHPDASSYRSPKAREESFSISSGLSALTPGVLTELTAEPVDATLSSSAAHSVRQIVDAADKLWATERPSTHLKLKLDDVGVAVRVEYRDGEVTATFQTDSPELRERLAAAWQAQVVTLSDHKPYRLAEPVFHSPSSSPFSGGAAGQEFSSGGDNARQFAQSRQSETPVMYPNLSSSRSEAAATAPVDVRPATPATTSARLHAFA